MTTPSQEARRWSAMILTALVAVGTPAVAGPVDTYFERGLMQSADQRCRLFDPAVSRALDAGVAQARGAALRANIGEAPLEAALLRAQVRASQTPCDSADLAVAAGRVRDAFQAWGRMARMTFPGDDADWRVDRQAYESQTWRMRQDHDGVTFGFAGAGTGHTLALAARGAGGSPLVSARVMVRDPSRAGSPWLAQGSLSLTPPAGVVRSFWAGRQIAAPEGLADEGARLFRFSTATADAIGRLDPREHFEIELTHADGSVRSVVLEAGDFAAARAFLAMGTL